MITAHKKHHGKCISQATKLTIALQAIQGKQTVSDISREHDVSRTTVYKQKDKAWGHRQLILVIANFKR